MPNALLWIWDATNEEWVKLAGTSGGAMSIHAIVEKLNDIEDVSVDAPTDGYVLYWDEASSLWKCKAIPAAAWADITGKPTAPSLEELATEHEADGTHGDITPTSCTEKYTNAEAVAAMGAKADDNPLHHDRYTDAEALAAAEAKFDNHNARHEAGGDDEIDVTNLSGLLADDQHVLDAEAVAAMGAKADDNPLHHDRYTDAEALAAATAGGLSKIVWKDASERALNLANQTTTIEWTDLDLTAYTSANAKFAILRLRAHLDSYTDGQTWLNIRKKGTTPTYMHYVYPISNPVSGNEYELGIIQALDSEQVIEYYVRFTGTAQVDYTIDVLGYIE